MEHRGSATPRAASDLRWVRGSTAATLGALVAIGVFLQLILGVNDLDDPRTVASAVATIVCGGLAIAGVPALLRPAPPRWTRSPLMLSAVVIALGVWTAALVPPFAGWSWAFLLVITGGMLACLATGWTRAAVFAALVAVVCLGFLTAEPLTFTPDAAAPDGTSDVIILTTLALMSVMPLSAVWVLRVVLRLDEARRLASDLAIATERLRFATDLHDIQGHHLQVIALKSELADRRLQVGETALAAAELTQIREIAQLALDDTRALVHDYRTVTVAVEARNAAAVLRSAGIACEARIEADDLPTPVGAVLALAIREATTNILRHSRATAASVVLAHAPGTGYRLTVTNDGARIPGSPGTGIAGITARVAEWDGTVQASRREDVFTLTVHIPDATAARQPKEAR